MIREVVHIDEDLCDGCGDCVPACHEGALQIIDGKARLISDLLCDGLGACLGHCPQGAITIEKREAEPYSETKVMEIMAGKGRNTVAAHLKHLKEHQEHEYLREGVSYLRKHASELDFDVKSVMHEVHNKGQETEQEACGCPGAAARSFAPASARASMNAGPADLTGVVPHQRTGGDELSAPHKDQAGMSSTQSELRQWPLQMHLVNPQAAYFRDADVLFAADCVAYALGDFHQKWLKEKSLCIACPKLDEGLESYKEKTRQLIDQAQINTLTVMMMQVPCCGGLLQIARTAAQEAERKVPVKAVIVGIEGEIISEEWV